jgi:RNA polymerase sigma factor (sigma-70 family)
MVNKLKDEEIIKRIIQDKNPELFGILHKRYYKKVVDKSYGFIKDKSLSEEFANDILSKAFEKLEGFKGNSSFSSWLFSITYNHCIDYMRLKKKLHYPDWNRNNVIPEIIDETEEDLWVTNYDDLIRLLENIHPEEKALILMKYQDGISLREMGETLRISEDAVKMRLKRARTRVIYLRKQELATK